MEREGKGENNRKREREREGNFAFKTPATYHRLHVTGRIHPDNRPLNGQIARRYARRTASNRTRKFHWDDNYCTFSPGFLLNHSYCKFLIWFSSGLESIHSRFAEILAVYKWKGILYCQGGDIISILYEIIVSRWGNVILFQRVSRSNIKYQCVLYFRISCLVIVTSGYSPINSPILNDYYVLPRNCRYPRIS